MTVQTPTEFAYETMRKQMLKYFEEPHTIEEFADSHGMHYKTAARWTKKLADAGHITVVKMDGNKKVFQALQSGEVPTVVLGGRRWKVDEFLRIGIPAAVGEREFRSSMAKQALSYRANLVYHLAYAILQAREEHGEPERPLNFLRHWLVNYHATLKQQIEEVENLLDHPTLWDTDDLIEWANSQGTFTGINRKFLDVLDENKHTITRGPNPTGDEE